MPTALQGGSRSRSLHEMRPGNWSAILFTIGMTLSLYSADAQVTATLKDKKNLVKYSRNNLDFLDAPLQQALNRGDYLVTGPRSLAGVQFSDKSYLRVNESSKVVIITGTRQRDVSQPESNSSVYGNLKGPGRFRGKQALCAVRGTEMEFIVENGRDVIRCFGPQGHQVLVTNSDNGLITGRVTTPGAAQFSSDDLVGNTENWIGARVQFITGNGKAQVRTVSAFDPNTGTVTVNAPLPNGDNQDAWFYLINPPNARVVVVEKNMETHVAHIVGANPVDPYPTEPKEFAGGDAFAFMNEPLHGNQQSHLTGYFHERTRLSYYELDNERDASQIYRRLSPGIQVVGANQAGSLGVGIGGGDNGGLMINIGGNGGGNRTAAGSRTPSPLKSGGRAIFPGQPRLIGASYSTTGSDSYLAAANESAVIGGLFLRASGRFASLDRQADNQVDELLVRYRNRHIGDIQVGRFHWFPGPVSNSELGRLVSFTSSDGILWDLPNVGNLGVQLAWFDKINPLAGPRAGGYSGRVTIPVLTGQLGVSALTTSQQTVGGTADFVYPVLPQKLEIYGEGGVDTAHQTVYALGFYLPQPFHKLRADLTMEWAYRGGFGHLIDFSAHVPLGRQFVTLISISKPGAGSWRPGIGIQARY